MNCWCFTLIKYLEQRSTHFISISWIHSWFYSLMKSWIGLCWFWEHVLQAIPSISVATLPRYCHRWCPTSHHHYALRSCLHFLFKCGRASSPFVKNIKVRSQVLYIRHENQLAGFYVFHFDIAGLSVAYVALRLQNPACELDDAWIQEDLDKAVSRIISLLQKASCPVPANTDDFENTSAPPIMMSAPAFSYCFPLIKEVLKRTSAAFKMDTVQALEIIDQHAHMRKSTNSLASIVRMVPSKIGLKLSPFSILDLR